MSNQAITNQENASSAGSAVAKGRLSPIEIAAAGASGAILLAFVVYWGLQIHNVMTMLEMAYG